MTVIIPACSWNPHAERKRVFRLGDPVMRTLCDQCADGSGFGTIGPVTLTELLRAETPVRRENPNPETPEVN